MYSLYCSLCQKLRNMHRHRKLQRTDIGNFKYGDIRQSSINDQYLMTKQTFKSFKKMLFKQIMYIINIIAKRKFIFRNKLWSH